MVNQEEAIATSLHRYFPKIMGIVIAQFPNTYAFYIEHSTIGE